MVAPAPRVSVVVPTHDRPGRLAALLASLREQTLSRDAFEVIVVDDASQDPQVAEVLAAAGRDGVRVIRHERSKGPAAARNAGWRAARAPLVAFTDDDCVAGPEWLERVLAAADANEGAIVQGRTDPIPEEAHLRSPFSRTQVIHELGPPFETCNIVFPRAVLERLGGFDETFRYPVGEDTDLAWRAVRAGVPAVFVPEAQVFHAVLRLGPLAMLRDALRWQHAVPLFAKHPDLRAAQLHRGLFWSPVHEHLARFLVALPLARRRPLLALALAWPYLMRLVRRRSGPLLAPYLLLHDLVEAYGIVRAAIRHRVPVL